MAVTYKATFKPEKRKHKETGELIKENVPLMLDLNYSGRTWYNTGIRLQHINDFDITAQKLKGGKKAYQNKELIAATHINSELDNIKGVISKAFKDAQANNIEFDVKYLLEQMKVLTGNKKTIQQKDINIHEEFKQCVDNWRNKNIIGEDRKRHYYVVLNILERFLTIKKLTKLTSKDFTNEHVMSFQEFLFNEYLYIDVYIDIYGDLPKNQTPKKRAQNTVATMIKKFKAFFAELEEKDIIPISPFRKIGKRERATMLKESYDEPYSLTLDELKKVISSEVPKHLARVKDVFLLHCAIGNRIEDFNSLTWNNIITDNGFYSVHYVPSKTSSTGDLKPIDTPLVKFAADIIEKHKGSALNYLAPIYKGNVSGKDGYNKKIKNLLQYLEINRGVIVRDNGQLKPVPLHSLASSKLARKTHVDITTKVALNKYISGLHTEGSEAVNRYTNVSLAEKFKIYCMAFKEDEYRLT